MNFKPRLIFCPTASSSTLFNPLINFRCSFSFRHKNTPLDNHIQRGKASQFFYKRRDFILNPQNNVAFEQSSIKSKLQMLILYTKETNCFETKFDQTVGSLFI
ncbi:hypothetical protein [Paenibacillus sp. NAIST15-1]|uniref:hypothetical protein n=1 Tax=Paenibacillus sp. NAIST15-1 TaxID=1605994 RepID=UPI0015880027|nr:hypothetical protein [Paenibacillus sp. NAIST15-1]